MNNIKNYKDFKLSLSEAIKGADAQDRADAINQYGQYAKKKDIYGLAYDFIMDRDYNNGDYLKSFKIILKKYKLLDDVMNSVGEMDDDSIDPAGGNGINSHK